MPLDVRPPKTVALTGDKRAVARYSPLESLQIEEVGQSSTYPAARMQPTGDDCEP